MRFVIALSLLVAAGCGYPCADRCHAARMVIAQQGYNPDTGETGGMDPDTVCEHERIQSAADCAECDAAFRETWRLVNTKTACDCPDDIDDATETILFYYDEQCNVEQLELSVDSCAQLEGSHTEACLG